MAMNGVDIIFATSFGYMEQMLNVAKEFPDVMFEHATGYKTADNMAVYSSKFVIEISSVNCLLPSSSIVITVQSNSCSMLNIGISFSFYSIISYIKKASFKAVYVRRSGKNFSIKFFEVCGLRLNKISSTIWLAARHV